MKISETILFDSGFRLVAHDGGVSLEAGDISAAEAYQLGEFLFNKFGEFGLIKAVNPDSIDGTRFCMPPDPDEKYAKLPEAARANDPGQMSSKALQESYEKDLAQIEELRNRRASWTSEIKVGDPNLAYSAPSSSRDGRQQIKGLEVTDLGAVAQKDGMFRRT